MTQRSYDPPLGAAAELWTRGDYAEISGLIAELGHDVVAAARVGPGTKVLDVGAGDGNAAIPAAAAGGHVVATDVTPVLLERGEQTSAAKGLSMAWRRADARDLPFADGEFDVVMSCIGAMFAPDHRRTAVEMARVCRRGGTIVMANWTPEGAAGTFFTLLGRYGEAAPPGDERPVDWGDPDHVRDVLGPHVDQLDSSYREVVLSFGGTPRELIDHYERYFPPVIATFAGLEEPQKRALDRDLIDFAERIDRAAPGDRPRYTFEYLLVTARRSAETS